MTSPKQKAANLRNAARSSGPKTELGRRRAAINAIKHGLSAPVESSIWGSKVSDLAALLDAEGLGKVDTHELARRLIEYERNVDYQRQRFQACLSGKPRQRIIPEGAQSDLELAARISLVREQEQTNLLGVDRTTAREMQQLFEMTAGRQIREANRDVERELKNADRHLRRAANQLIKKLKQLNND